MKKVIWTFGTISGIIVTIIMLINVALLNYDDPSSFSTGMLVGYASMLIALSAVFFGIKSYRDTYLDGTISFGRAFMVGLNITLVCSAIYVVGWMIYSATPGGDQFIEGYTKFGMDQIQNSGMSQLEMEKAIVELKKEMENYSNPLVKIMYTFIEIFPVGLVVTLISAAILKKSGNKPQLA